MSKKIITLGHSPDADDAFMFYAISKGIVKSDKFEFRHFIKDIQTLNKMAIGKELDTTAVSAYAYVQLYDSYRIMDCGASMGNRYGPIVVAKPGTKMTKGIRIAIPGKSTSAFLLLRLYCDDAKFVEYNFDEIMPAIINSEVDAGLIIHEGQITFGAFGLNLLLDIPKLWHNECKYPIPLGLNVVSRSLDLGIQIEISKMIKQSISYALSNTEEALDYAMEFGRGISRDIAKKFIFMYVNEDTLDLNYRGINGLKFMYTSAFTKGLIEKNIELDIILT